MVNCPVIHITPGLDYEKLNLRVCNINVLKPKKKEGEATKTGYTLRFQFSYVFEEKEYMCDNLRIRFDSGKIRRISTGPNGSDLSSFTMIDEDSPKFSFLKYLHTIISDFLVEKVTKIQPGLYTQCMLNFDEEFGDSFNKKNKSSADIVAEIRKHYDSFDEVKKKTFDKLLNKTVKDTFRFQRKKNQDWCLLKPSNVSEETFNLGLAVYRQRDDSKSYDLKVYEVENGKLKRMLKGDEIENAVGGMAEKKGMIDFEHLVIEMKSPHMNASEEAISFGFMIRYIGVSSIDEEEEYDPSSNTFVPVSKQEIKKRDEENEKSQDASPSPKKMRMTTAFDGATANLGESGDEFVAAGASENDDDDDADDNKVDD
jgi:hypothetical protein